MCLDSKGRILASDQYGGLFRFSPPPIGQTLDPKQIEKVPVEIRAVNGMLWAFGALYVGSMTTRKRYHRGSIVSRIPMATINSIESSSCGSSIRVGPRRACRRDGTGCPFAVFVCGNGIKTTRLRRLHRCRPSGEKTTSCHGCPMERA